MDRLDINLPILNKEWVEARRYDIEERAFNEFEMMNSIGWAEELDSHDFEEKYDNCTSDDVRNWRSNYLDNYLYYKVPEYAERIFKERDLWEKHICTEQLIEDYNEAVKDLVHWLSFNIALSWARCLNCDVKEDWGVIPYKEQ